MRLVRMASCAVYPHGRGANRSAFSRAIVEKCGSAAWPDFFESPLVLGGGERELGQCGQATKGAWGMSWHQEAMKGVEDCEKLGGAVKRALIPRYPNQTALNT
jgi:hypothetical protein